MPRRYPRWPMPLVMALFAIVSSPTCVAGDDASAAAPANVENDAVKPANEPAWITESRIVFPARTARFELLRNSRDPDPLLGANLLYRDTGADIDFDIYVYPIGSLTVTEAMNMAAHDLYVGFEQAARAGLYAEMQFGRLRELETPLADGSVLAARQLSFTGEQAGRPVISQALLAYRDFYFIKLRATAAKEHKRALADLVDSAATELFTQIRVQSRGNCRPAAKPSLVIVGEMARDDDPVSADGSLIYAKKRRPSERQLEKLLAEAARRRHATNCVASFEALPLQPGDKSETLRFPADTWQTSTPVVRMRKPSK